ncbi:transposase [Streptomyces niveus]|uniref:transposase n=1 Tax=Streptomyces niveus TaxID=193462 RepID=UPI00386CF4B2
MQGFLAKAAWDADALRDRVRAVAALAADDAVLIADETGDIKKGTKTAGVQRQYTGTVGRIENTQVGVHLSYGSGRGRTVDWKPRKPRCAGWSRSSNAARSTSISTARCSRPAAQRTPRPLWHGDDAHEAGRRQSHSLPGPGGADPPGPQWWLGASRVPLLRFTRAWPGRARLSSPVGTPTAARSASSRISYDRTRCASAFGCRRSARARGHGPHPSCCQDCATLRFSCL